MKRPATEILLLVISFVSLPFISSLAAQIGGLQRHEATRYGQRATQDKIPIVAAKANW